MTRGATDNRSPQSSPHRKRQRPVEASYISSGGEDNDEQDTKPMKKALNLKMPPTNQPPLLQNPLYQSQKLWRTHVHSLRLEADLAPMRTIVARLMTNPTHNRRGIFNYPVDPVALKLVDYTKIVTKPMDLGTIKARLHAVAYHSRDEVASEIRLVFTNAIRYNPPDNTVSICAKHLKKQFDEWFEVLKATKHSPLDEPGTPLPAPRKMLTIQPWLTPKHVVPPSASPRLRTRGGDPSTTQGSKQQQPPCAPMLFSSETAHPVVSSEEPPKPAGEQPQEQGPEAPTKSSKLHVHSNWKDPGPMDCEKALKRAMNIASKHAKHTCGACLGRQCDICHQGCLQHEPPLLICTGSNCAGSKIRKGAEYYIAKDGSRQFCKRCYANLQAVLPTTSDQLEHFGTAVRYKRDLLKRRNDEEVPEQWISCSKCKKGVHKVCAMYHDFSGDEADWICPTCSAAEGAESTTDSIEMKLSSGNEMYSFISGSRHPVPLSDVQTVGDSRESKERAEDLPETPISAFIQRKVRDRMDTEAYPHSDRTVTVRMISTSDKYFKVPDVVRKHFRMQQESDRSAGVLPPSKVHYSSKAMMLFQKIDGLDVCIFCMYVQEYDGSDDEFDDDREASQKKRVYIAYLDSVEHFRPRISRTKVYHEILVSYLATARARGFERAHIWACPPSRGNSFVFWNHPASQRTPTKDRLLAWYHAALSRAVVAGVVTDVTSLYESSFQEFMESQEDSSLDLIPAKEQQGVVDGRLLCPPLLDGDFWMEEAVRSHGANISRFMKSRALVHAGEPPLALEIDPLDRGCPATELATLLRDRIIPHPLAVAFRKPVNAAALKLKDYHKIITSPMDLGTVYSNCLLGEYHTVDEFVSDVELTFRNAMTYNPKGNPVHNDAFALQATFYGELETGIFSRWLGAEDGVEGWKRFANVCMSLDTRIDVKPDPEVVKKHQEQLKNESKPKPAIVENDEPLSVPPDIMRSVAPETDMEKTPALSGPVIVPETPAIPPVPLQPTSLQTEGCRPVAKLSKELETKSDEKLETPVSALPIARPATPVAVTGTKPRRPRLKRNGSSMRSILPDAGRKPVSLHSPMSLRRTSVFKPPKGANIQFPLSERKQLDIICDGPDAIEQRMVGEDVWLLEKKPTSVAPCKKSNGKRKRNSIVDHDEEPLAPKRRRQSWLGEEVGASIRKMRAFFFTCSLESKIDRSEEERDKEEAFDQYIADFHPMEEDEEVPSNIADQRHALLEFSQCRNLEFDTLRRAKYSTALLLYHLHNNDAPGLVPHCTSCRCAIQNVRWHRVRNARLGRLPPNMRRIGPPPARIYEELCGRCVSPSNEDFIPLPVSFTTPGNEKASAPIA